MDLNLKFFGLDAQKPNDVENIAERDENESGDGKKFSQEQVNNIVAKESKKATERLFKEIGLACPAKGEQSDFLKRWAAEQSDEAIKKYDEASGELSRTRDELRAVSARYSALRRGVDSDYVEDVILLANRLVDKGEKFDEAIDKIIAKYPNMGSHEISRPTFSTFIRGEQEKSVVEQFVEAFK